MGQAASSANGVPAESVRAELEKILASQVFTHSERLCRFLQFAVEEALQGRGAGLKEYHIGVKVFDRKESYDPRIDPIVRVEAGRLRTKLEEFYRSEGRGDPIVIGLNKGSCTPVFQLGQSVPSLRARMLSGLRVVRDPRAMALLVAVMIALAAVFWAIALWRQNLALRNQIQTAKLEPPQPELSLIWKQFLAPGAKNLAIFGSPVFFASDRERLFLRWGGSSETASDSTTPHTQQLQERFGPLSGPRHDYALMGDALALQRLTAFFGRTGAALNALPAHMASWEALQDTNVVFLGAPRMIPLLARLPVRQDFEWDANHNIVNRKPQPGEQVKYVTSSHYDEVSYALIGSYPGLQANRQMLLLTAHSAPGTAAAIDHLTQPERVRELIQRLGLSKLAGPAYYQVLLRVIVDKGDRVKSEYVTHHLVAPVVQQR